MKPLNLFLSGLLFAAVIISFGGWYANMVSDYSHLGATPAINTTQLRHIEVMENISATQSEVESGIKKSINNIPIVGGVLVQVFSTFQILKSFFLSMWDALTIGLYLISGITELLAPYFTIHPDIIRLMEIGILVLFVGSIVYLILNRRMS